MKVIGDVTVALPYTMDFCAKGPDVEPLFVDYKNVHITVFFPPSMSDGTVGQSFFPSGWAWWTGQSLRITLEQPLLESDIDMAALRTTMRDAANWILFQLLNAYRARMDRPEIYPVKIDPKLLVLTIEYSNGEVDALPEPEDAFFYRSLPDDAPLQRSINSQTLGGLMQDISSNNSPSTYDLLILDAEWLEAQGDFERATVIRTAAAKLLS